MADGHAPADPPATQGRASSENGTDMARALPAAPPTPRTRSEIRFNQLNTQQIPPSTLDRLSPEQIQAFHRSTLERLESADVRRHELSMARMERVCAAERRNAWIGGLLGITSLGGACVLALHGHAEVAMAVVATLATITAVVAGSKLVK